MEQKVKSKKGGGISGYHPAFAQEVFENVDFGDEIKMCMQCGVCAASCPLSLQMDHLSCHIFTMIRAGKREEVLNSQSILLCTSCYTCKVRCPRGIPVVDVMHGLAHYAIRLGYLPRRRTAAFGQEFWNQIYRLGRIDEKDLSRRYFFSEGLVEGMKMGIQMADMGIAMVLHKRMKLLPERKIKGIKDLRKMLDKAEAMGKGGAKA
jgi:quinone-modifying oxidoreductase subunit QmoC